MSTNIPYSVASNAKEFLAGMVAEQASYYKEKEKAAKDITSFISAVDKDLRSVYDKYIPNVHVIDVESFTNILANRMSLNPERFLDKGSDTSVAFKFGNPKGAEYIGLFNTIKDSLSKYHSSLLSSQGGVTNPVEELNKLSTSLFNRTRKIDNPVSARVLGQEFSARIRKVFGNRAVLAVVEPRLGSSDTRFVFFSSSFNSITAAIRKEVYTNIQDYIRSTLGTDTLSDFTVGSIVNTGHAALISDLDSFVNTPAFATTIYGVGSGRSSRFSSSQVAEAAEVFKQESKILENSIKVDKSFTSGSSGYGVLLSLGVTFTNIEDAELNGFRGSKYERTAVTSFKIQKPSAATRSTTLRIQQTLMRMVFRNNPLLAKSSRNVLEFIEDAVVGELIGKRTKSEKTSKTVTVKKRVTQYSQNARTTKKGKFEQPKVKSTKVALNAGLQLHYSLASLQAILDANLVRQIKQNMGDGSRRDVLNLQTGRFAESVKVERLSQSREGMITAFYSYMKNPYATFSRGGQQERPYTRDPKLLIAKSIREIASQQVANRLRAVNV